MKKIFTLLAAAAIMLSASAETIILSNPGKTKGNPLSDSELGDGVSGWTLSLVNITTEEDGTEVITPRTDKEFQSGNEVTIDDTKYRTIKFSNGAWNFLELPAGYVATGVTFYTVINADPSDAVNYWSVVNGVKYSPNDAEGTQPATIVESWKDFENPTVCEFTFENKVDKFTFKNSGKQPLAVIVVTYEEGTPTTAISAVAVDQESNQMYNVLGQPVDAGFKGLVIKNGKKFINK